MDLLSYWRRNTRRSLNEKATLKSCSSVLISFKCPDEGERQCWEHLKPAALAAMSRRQSEKAGGTVTSSLPYAWHSLQLSPSFVWPFPAWVFINIKLIIAPAKKKPLGNKSRFQHDIITYLKMKRKAGLWQGSNSVHLLEKLELKNCLLQWVFFLLSLSDMIFLDVDNTDYAFCSLSTLSCESLNQTVIAFTLFGNKSKELEGISLYPEITAFFTT